jgi:acyl-CoA synthetase (NDP forming)
MKRFFQPAAIAVVGASANENAIGGKPIRQLRQHGYAGRIYPVNPNRDVVQDLRAYRSVLDLPDGVDLAIVAVAAPRVQEVIEQCGQRGIPYAVVLSSGFADAGHQGAERQAELVAAAREAGVSILGPNCVGFIGMRDGVYAGFGAFFDYDFAPGPVSFVTQSGGVGGSLLTIGDDEGIGFGHFVHTGNAADIDIEAVLDYFTDDPHTGAMLAYIEGLGGSGRLPEVAYRALANDKPLLVWKAGQHEASSNAVVSHTGRMAGDMARFRALFRKYGVIEVSDTADMVDVLRIAQTPMRATGGRLGVISVSGGAGVVAADFLETASGLSLADLPEEAVAEIAGLLPDFATSRNPIDVTAQIFNEPELFERVVGALTRHRCVDQILACVASVHSEVGLRVAEAIVEARQALGVPIVVAWAARDSLNGKAFRLLREAGIPVFRSPERALRAMDSMMTFYSARSRIAEIEAPGAPGGGLAWARSVEFDVLEALAQRGVAVPAQRLAATPAEAGEAAEEIGYPVVVKVQSPDIPHKADAGGVRLHLADREAAEAAAREILARAGDIAGAEVRGVVVQRMAEPGTELILGYLRDTALGGFLLFGRGGSGVEAMDDRVLVAAPAGREEILSRLAGLRIVAQQGIGKDGLNAIADVALGLQELAAASAPGLAELEVNPVIVRAGTVTAVDALAIEA